MPDVTVAPHWDWLAIGYFFLGGLAGGSYFLAGMLDLFGREEDRPLVRLGYRVALPCLLVGSVLLVVDLTRPERFWHMLVLSKEGRPAFKAWSPMSVGAWALLLFGLFAVASLWASREARPLRRGPLRFLLVGLGMFFGFFLAGYTGVLLAVTNRPLWADSAPMGALFLLSGASTSAALLWLLSRDRAAVPPDARRWLARTDAIALALELGVLVAVWFLAGESARRVWSGGWLALLALVLLGGILVPLAIHARPREAGPRLATLAAVLVLVGGFLLRVVVVLPVEGA